MNVPAELPHDVTESPRPFDTGELPRGCRAVVVGLVVVAVLVAMVLLLAAADRAVSPGPVRVTPTEDGSTIWPGAANTGAHPGPGKRCYLIDEPPGESFEPGTYTAWLEPDNARSVAESRFVRPCEKGQDQ